MIPQVSADAATLCSLWCWQLPLTATGGLLHAKAPTQKPQAIRECFHTDLM